MQGLGIEGKKPQEKQVLCGNKGSSARMYSFPAELGTLLPGPTPYQGNRSGG